MALDATRALLRQFAGRSRPRFRVAREPLSVRNTLNDLVWIVGLVCYFALTWWIRHVVGGGRVQVAADLVLIPASAVFLAWSGRVLSAKRIDWKHLAPFAILGAVLFAISMGAAAVYLPHLFSSYASRYGVVGAVLAMVSALFAAMLVVVGSAVGERSLKSWIESGAASARPRTK